MTLRFVNADIQHVYKQGFVVLDEKLKHIESIRERNDVPPSVTLSATNERDLKKLALKCIIGGSPISPKALKDNSGAVQALKTMTAAFSERIPDMDLELDLNNNPKAIKELQAELMTIQTVLQGSLKTIWYVYRTLHLETPTEEQTGEEIKVEGSKTFGPRYLDLKSLLEGPLTRLLKSIEAKLEDIAAEAKQKQSETLTKVPPIEVEILMEFDMADFEESPPPTPTSQHVQAFEAMGDTSLLFNNAAEASKWFCTTLEACRSCKRKTNIADRERFIEFAKSLDAVFKKEEARQASVREIQLCLRIVFIAKGLQISELSTFEGLLTELYDKKADNEVYQAFFCILINEERTGPRGLGYHPAILNAIMNSADYFPLFDADHITPFKKEEND